MAPEINLEEDLKPRKEEIKAGANGSDKSDDISKKRRRNEDNVGADEERGQNSSCKEEEEEEKAVVSLGGKKFRTSREIFEYFDSLIRSPDFHIAGKDYFPMLLDLVKKGHPEPEKLMIGSGVTTSFLVHNYGLCSGYLTFFVCTKDSAVDFCFRTCIDNILPLPEDLKEQGTGVVCACHLPKPKDEDRELIMQPRYLSTSDGVFLHFFYMLYGSPLNEAIKDRDRRVLLELFRKGDPVGWETKFGSGSKVDQYSFQARIHPDPMSAEIGLRTFVLVHQGDDSVEEFCYINLVDSISPLPKEAIDKYNHPCSCHREGGGKGDMVSLGITKFHTCKEMLQYFREWLSRQPLNTPITNERFCTVARDLVRKGYPELGKKIGSSPGGFLSYRIEVRSHPVWTDDRSYCLVGEDGSMEIFCLWTCINKILPLAEEDTYNCCRATGLCCDLAAAAADAAATDDDDDDDDDA